MNIRYWLKQIIATVQRSKIEFGLASSALLLSVFVLMRVYPQGLLLVLADQVSHLNFARLATNSLTPGISQIGSWPPLLHLLMIPTAFWDFLYYTGLAGVPVLLLFLMGAAVVFYKIAYRLTANKLLSCYAALILLINPYILYYSLTPMMEVLFIANLIFLVYVLLLWVDTGRVLYLILTGFMVSLVCLSRYEGLIILPLVTLVVLWQLVKKNKNWRKVEASAILFSLVSVIGLVFILLYNAVYSGNPLEFMMNSWNISTQGFTMKNNLWLSIQAFFHAGYYMISKEVVWIAIISVFILLMKSLRTRNDVLLLILLFILFSPALMVILNMFRGKAPIFVPELLPFNHKFHNVRYGLPLLPFVVLAITVLINNLRNLERYSKIGKILGGIMSVVVLYFSITHFYQVIIKDDFAVIKNDISATVEAPSDDGVIGYLRDNYDYGKVLSKKYNNDFIFLHSHISLDNYIYEGNYFYFEQALETPWLFARWIVMDNVNANDSSLELDPVSKKLSKSSKLSRYYNLVFSDKTRMVYKINEEAVRGLVQQRGYNGDAIPSLNNTHHWDTEKIYYAMGIKGRLLVDADEIIKEKTMDLRESITEEYLSNFGYFKNDYQQGYVLDGSGHGNSETQSYMLLQAYVANDKETFDKVWQWTKGNIQRPDDALFSWDFTVKNGVAKIMDANPATDADEDIAYALIKAGERWSDENYIQEARKIIKGIWDKEVVEYNHRFYVVAGNWANTHNEIKLNPSYFSPFTYKTFAQYDPEHDWNKVVYDGYEILDEVSQHNFDKGLRVYLPPNWIAVNKKTGKFIPFEGKKESYNYSYDAFRTFWRVAMDYNLHKESKAKEYLSKITIFDDNFTQNNFCSIMQIDGKCSESIAAMSGPLSVFYVNDTESFNKIIEKYYLSNSRVIYDQHKDIAFYDRSWYWFGLFLWLDVKM